MINGDGSTSRGVGKREVLDKAKYISLVRLRYERERRGMKGAENRFNNSTRERTNVTAHGKFMIQDAGKPGAMKKEGLVVRGGKGTEDRRNARDKTLTQTSK